MFCVCILTETHKRQRRNIASSACAMRYFAARFASSSVDFGVALGFGLGLAVEAIFGVPLAAGLAFGDALGLGLGLALAVATILGVAVAMECALGDALGLGVGVAPPISAIFGVALAVELALGDALGFALPDGPGLGLGIGPVPNPSSSIIFSQ